MKRILRLTGIAAICLTTAAQTLTSCSNDDYDTQQYKGGVNLNVWGPRPVARGGELRFLGSGMDQITSIAIPGSGEVTQIKVVSSEEIRITVPQDAEPGKVTLTHAGGKIESLTTLSFTEPISLESMTPSTVKPGNTLTLAGEYLNLIKEVVLSDGVTVSQEDFITHSRKEISFKVPFEAQTGEIIISDGGNPIPNWIYSEEELKVVLPTAVSVADLSRLKPGQTVTVKMNDIDLVRTVEMPGGHEVDFMIENDNLSFVLPANISDGTVCAVPASGVKVAIATIGIAVPENVTADPAEGIWSGDEIKFKGVNMELVTSVTFPNAAEDVIPTAVSTDAVTVTVPAGTQSGNAILHTASGAEVAVAVATLKPEAVSFNPNPAALASILTVQGRNLSNVASVTLGGSTTVEIQSPGASEFTFTVPATLPSGENSVALTLSNGETVNAGSVNLTAPECAYATELPADDAEINAGETVTFTIANESKLTGVKVNGENVQYILNGTRLIIQIPANTGKSATVTLVSSNGEISYILTVIPATHVENIIFNEVRDLGSWAGEDAGGAFRLYKPSFEGVPAGAKLVFHISPYGYTQIQVNDANWGQIDMLVPAENDSRAELELTADILSRIMETNDGWSETAFVIQGQGTVVSKVHIEWENSLETTIWEGSWENTSWSGNQDLAWGGYDWSSVKPNSIMRLYLTPLVADGEWWCVSLRHGDSWANLPDPVPSQYDTPSLPLEVRLPKNILDDLNANGGLVISGTGYRLNKVTIE